MQTDKRIDHKNEGLDYSDPEQKITIKYINPNTDKIEPPQEFTAEVRWPYSQ